MITYINAENRDKYTVLFDKASAKLGLAPIIRQDENGDDHYFKRVQKGDSWSEVELKPEELNENKEILVNGKPVQQISSLNDYFQHIVELSQFAIGNGRTGSDPYFLRLPLDEPFLEINANTRAITVPNELRQVAVVGDHLAEVVFFRIDRYYDAIDLNTREIYIEWQDAAGNRGVSREFLRDVQSQKDKIVFGWAIGDELTKTSGNIRFSVRFVEWYKDTENAENGKIVYSFSSLPAQMSVVDSLHYSLLEDLEDTQSLVDTLIYNLENSEPDVAGETAPELAKEAVFLKDLDVIGTVKNDVLLANLDGDSLKLVVEAYSPDAGSIIYTFARRDQSDAAVNPIVAKIEFVKAEDTTEKNRIYYEKGAEDTYVPIAQSDLQDDGEYYIRQAYMVAKGPGFYNASVNNRVSGKKPTKVAGKMLYIPYAAKPEVEKTMAERFVIKEQAYEEKLIEGIDQSDKLHLFDSNIEFVAGEAGDASIVLAPEIKAVDGEAAGLQTLSYQWYKADNKDMTDAVAIEGATEATYEATEPGFYSLTADNFYNNDHTALEIASAGVCRITNMPKAATVDAGSWSRFENVIKMDGNIKNAPIMVEAPAEYDSVHFEWHRISSDSTDFDPIIAGTDFEANTPVEGDLVFSNGKAPIVFAPIKAGGYYIVLKTRLNGAEIAYNVGTDTSFGVIAVEA